MRRAQTNSVARMAMPAGMTINAGPGNTSSAMPIKSTVNPTTATIILFIFRNMGGFAGFEVQGSKFEVEDKKAVISSGEAGNFEHRTSNIEPFFNF